MCFLYFFRGFSWFQAFLYLIWALNSHQTMPRPPRLYIYNKKYIRTKFWQPSGALVIYSWKVLSRATGRQTQKNLKWKLPQITQILRCYCGLTSLNIRNLTGVHFHVNHLINRKTVLRQALTTHIQVVILPLYGGQSIDRGLYDAHSQNTPPHYQNFFVCVYFWLHLKHLPSIPYLYIYSLKNAFIQGM